MFCTIRRRRRFSRGPRFQRINLTHGALFLRWHHDWVALPESSSVSEREPDRLPAQQAGALYLEYSQQLLAFATGLLRDRELAQDVVQVTFGKALEHAGAIPPEGRKAWLFRVARNEALLVRRREGVTQRAFDRISRSSPGDRGREPPQELASQEQAQRVRAALNQLPEPQQWVVQQRFFHGRTFAEMAEELHVPLGTVLTRMRLALGKLEQALQSRD